jgi:hypothetical protein
MRETLKRTLLILIASVFALSCNQSKYVNRDILKSITAKVDKMQVSYYRSADTASIVITDKHKIDLICYLIDGKVDDTLKECQHNGCILLYSNNKLVFESLFTLGNNCTQLSYYLSPQQYNTKLTYQAGMLLSEAMGNAK